MPLPLMIHSALALFAQRTRIPTSARSIGFCVIWVCISSSSLIVAIQVAEIILHCGREIIDDYRDTAHNFTANKYKRILLK